jgi:hypothetical protein
VRDEVRLSLRADYGQFPYLPKSKNPLERAVIMGEVRKSGIPPKAFERNPKLEAALDRMLQGIRQSRGA